MYFSFSLILLAILADGLDGIIARRTRHGELGEYLEAMADMTSLGIAPAIFVYFTYSSLYATSLLFSLVLIIALLLFLGCSIIRLSSFHSLKEKDFFIGLPASASTIFLVVLVFFEVPLPYILIVLILISILMISPIRFLKPGRYINTVACILILLSIALGRLYMGIAPILLILALAVYTIAGPFIVKKSVATKTV